MSSWNSKLLIHSSFMRCKAIAISDYGKVADTNAFTGHYSVCRHPYSCDYRSERKWLVVAGTTLIKPNLSEAFAAGLPPARFIRFSGQKILHLTQAKTLMIALAQNRGFHYLNRQGRRDFQFVKKSKMSGCW